MNKLLELLKGNVIEIYLGTLLFVAVPLSVGLLFNFRIALLLSLLAQSIITILYVRRG